MKTQSTQDIVQQIQKANNDLFENSSEIKPYMLTQAFTQKEDGIYYENQYKGQQKVFTYSVTNTQENILSSIFEDLQLKTQEDTQERKGPLFGDILDKFYEKRQENLQQLMITRDELFVKKQSQKALTFEQKQEELEISQDLTHVYEAIISYSKAEIKEIKANVAHLESKKLSQTVNKLNTGFGGVLAAVFNSGYNETAQKLQSGIAAEKKLTEKELEKQNDRLTHLQKLLKTTKKELENGEKEIKKLNNEIKKVQERGKKTLKRLEEAVLGEIIRQGAVSQLVGSDMSINDAMKKASESIEKISGLTAKGLTPQQRDEFKTFILALQNQEVEVPGVKELRQNLETIIGKKTAEQVEVLKNTGAYKEVLKQLDSKIYYKLKNHPIKNNFEKHEEAKMLKECMTLKLNPDTKLLEWKLNTSKTFNFLDDKKILSELNNELNSANQKSNLNKLSQEFKRLVERVEKSPEIQSAWKAFVEAVKEVFKAVFEGKNFRQVKDIAKTSDFAKIRAASKKTNFAEKVQESKNRSEQTQIS